VNNFKEQPLALAYDVVNGLLAWGNNELDQDGVIELFQHLVDSGLAWQLEGHIGRCAQSLIDAGEITRPAPKAVTLPEPGNLLACEGGKNIGPFVGVDYECVIAFRQARRRDRKFHVFTYQAYNACGLIGHECNGVAVCDIERGQVLCDEIAKQATGYFGASDEQVETIKRLLASSWAEFREVINSSPRARYHI
jgi:hypothetical protein